MFSSRLLRSVATATSRNGGSGGWDVKMSTSDIRLDSNRLANSSANAKYLLNMFDAHESNHGILINTFISGDRQFIRRQICHRLKLLSECLRAHIPNLIALWVWSCDICNASPKAFLSQFQSTAEGATGQNWNIKILTWLKSVKARAK